MTASPSLRVTRVLLRIVAVVALLFAFLVAITLMGDAFHLLGEDFAASLVTATSSPIVGLCIGILTTAIIQSSSVTTSMVVGLVSAGGLTLESAIPIVMGANIGTSVTNTIVSLGHMGNRTEFRQAFSGAIIHDLFNWFAVLILLPLEIMTGFLARTATFLADHLTGSASLSYESPIKLAVEPVAKAVTGLVTGTAGLADAVAGAVVLAVALLLIFICLGGLVKVLKTLMSQSMEGLIHRALSKGPLVTMGIGLVVTAAVQSSSVTTSILVPLVATGLVRLEHAFPITLGANAGTTVTALLASLAGNVHGLAIALVHTLFNVAGILIIYPLAPIRRIPLRMARWLGQVASERRVIALLFIALVSFVLPLVVIFVERALG